MKKLTTEQFIIKANIVHNNKYNYSETKYINSTTKINILCLEHGLFFQIPYDHLKGHGCSKCCFKNLANKNRMTTIEFIEKANKIHNNYYSYSQTDYIGSHNKIKIICPKHGEFQQIPNSHLNGSGCPICRYEKSTQKRVSTTEKFIENALKVHGNYYNYSKVQYINNYTKVKIFCNKCAIFFNQKPNHHLTGHGCPKCNSSKGELAIAHWLNNKSIYFVSEKKFDNCRNPQTNRLLEFDFYVPSHNLIIEFDGKQHYENIKFFNNCLEENQFRDLLKNKYCENYKINIIRIPYFDFDNINEILGKCFRLI